MNTDDLFDEMDRFDLEGAEKLTPREFARLIAVAPQMAYYYIRIGVLETETCICGRRVLDVAKAKEALQARKASQRRNVHTD